MKKILLLGSTGMLGWQLLKSLQDLKNYKIFASYKNQQKLSLLKKNLKIKKNVIFIKFDINKSSKFNYSNYDYVVNCIGVIKPFINENNQDSIKNAIKINSLFPHDLITKSAKTKVFQIATDCVFSGSDGNYNEMSKHDALDVYGKSKSLGEVNIKNFFNIRVSIIGKELDTKNSLVEWFLSNEKKEKIFGFKDHLWNGVTTSVFSHILYTIINKKINIPNNFHLIPKDKVNKFKLMQLLKNHYGFKNLKIIKKNSNNRINRILETNHKILNDKIWSNSKYKRKLSIEEIISTL